MLFKCFECESLGFFRLCHSCSAPRTPDQSTVYRTPVDPKLFTEFQFEADHIFQEILPPLKRKAEDEFQQLVDRVLGKYEKLREPYFVNFLYLSEGSFDGSRYGRGKYTNLRLLRQVLLNQGFEELNQYEPLTRKFAQSTSLQISYSEFKRRSSDFLQGDLRSTLSSWIEERGTEYRSKLPMMLYLIYEKDVHQDEVRFTEGSIPLVGEREVTQVEQLCDEIHFKQLVDRFQVRLEEFDPSQFVTIYNVDAMSGTEFEEFLATLFETLGYQVETTKTVGDQGADLFAERFGTRTVIQAKNYTKTVGNSAVQQVVSAKDFYGCDKAMVVTNSRFSSSARDLADTVDVRLVDRDGLASYLDDFNLQVMQASKGGESGRGETRPEEEG